MAVRICRRTRLGRERLTPAEGAWQCRLCGPARWPEPTAWRLLWRAAGRWADPQQHKHEAGHEAGPRKRDHEARNVDQRRAAEECRIAIVEDGVLEELYIERTSQDNYVGNIYKGKVVNLEPSIQAAFVDFGVGRNGFLHISDIEPQYYRQGGFDPSKPLESAAGRSAADVDPDEDDDDAETAKQPRRRRAARVRGRRRPRVKPPIQDILPPRRRSAGAGDQGRASAPRAPRSRPISAFPAATWC